MGRFNPAIILALRGYRRADFFADLGAGLTVGLIALPLAIGFGIASGVTPQQGLWTGIVASVVVALLGGSQFQVAGPTGAFVPVLFSVVATYGYGGLALATTMAGVMWLFGKKNPVTLVRIVNVRNTAVMRGAMLRSATSPAAMPIRLMRTWTSV